MFVYHNRLILKTCGTTTLLHALPRIIVIALAFKLDRVVSLFYSRKKFMFPEQQSSPHGRWEHEVGYLDDIFCNQDNANEVPFRTAAYTVGRVNGEHWCIYLAYPEEENLPVCEIEDRTMSSMGISESEEGSEPTLRSESDEEGGAIKNLSLSFAKDFDFKDVTLEVMMTGLCMEKMACFWRRQEEKNRDFGPTENINIGTRVYVCSLSVLFC